MANHDESLCYGCCRGGRAGTLDYSGRVVRVVVTHKTHSALVILVSDPALNLGYDHRPPWTGRVGHWHFLYLGILG